MILRDMVNRRVGTHPTGMHSSFIVYLLLLILAAIRTLYGQCIINLQKYSFLGKIFGNDNKESKSPDQNYLGTLQCLFKRP